MPPRLPLTDSRRRPLRGQLRGPWAWRPERPVDLSHGVEPFNVAQAPFPGQLEHFPPGTSSGRGGPGVGGPRPAGPHRAGAHHTGQRPRRARPGRHPTPGSSTLGPMPGAASHTFHGRDVLAPLPARWPGEAPQPGPALDPPPSARGLDSPAPSPPSGTASSPRHSMWTASECVLNLDARPGARPCRRRLHRPQAAGARPCPPAPCAPTRTRPANWACSRAARAPGTGLQSGSRSPALAARVPAPDLTPRCPP
jgi:hypothetical protein